jgi:hypothetical protein
MAEMGRYCKAYLVKDLRAFPGWREDAGAIRHRDEESDGDRGGAAPDVLVDDDILYLQENYVVTDGIFIDENVVFADVTPEWREFCAGPLAFEVPEDDVEPAAA